jgi:16S rRNA (cytidine1402-2'-O)-methyltransferase
VRALRVLRESRVIAAEDTRAARNLLGRHGIEPPEVISFFEGNEAARSEQLVQRLLAGEDVTLISEAGTPAVSDPGQRLVARAIAAGATVVPLPGASAVLAALVASGLPTETFLFAGFPPRDSGPRREVLARLRHLPATLVFYEGPARVGRTLADLADVFGAARRGCVSREITKVHEEHVRGTLGELAQRYAAEAPRGEVTMVVEGAPFGEVAPELDVEAEVRRRLELGMSPKEVAAALALATGKPRRQIYQLALALRPRRD